MYEKKWVGLVYGPNEHHLDHVACLCALMDIPLVVTEERLGVLAEKFYPDVVVFCWDFVEMPDRVVREFDVVVTTLPRTLFDEVFLVAEGMRGKKLLNVWCPHGNSDKGHLSKAMEALGQERMVLVYGQKMLDFVQSQKVSLKYVVAVGNYRYLYFQKMKRFYEGLVGEMGRVLFAPTWEDEEGSCSLFEALPKLAGIEGLVVKPHPNTRKEKPFELDELKNQFTGVQFVEEFPPIYPLLDRMDAYVGDMSSIGYDFLTFNRPMYFLNPKEREDEGTYLYRCGESFGPGEYDALDVGSDQGELAPIRKEVYNYTFLDRPFEAVLHEMHEMVERYFEIEVM